MVLIDALFINKGGGAVLLQYLVEKILAHPQKDNFFFVLDPRFDKPAALTKNYIVINNKISERIKFYGQNKERFTTVLCFANTPPPIKLDATVYTYFQNQKLLEAPKQKFNPKFFKLYLKYLFVKRYNNNTDYYIVQTPHMVRELIVLGLKDNAHVLTIPFYNDGKYRNAHQPFNERTKDEFVFIGNPSPQKNYPTLLDSWEYLLQQGHAPMLHVTIDDTVPHLIARVNALVARGAKITNHVYLNPGDLYFNCPYLIFPSVMESFGLPLVEAADSGMKILASDLPYVHDVITPSLTFDPNNKISIANAVIKALTTDLPFPEMATRNEVDRLVALLIEQKL